METLKTKTDKPNHNNMIKNYNQCQQQSNYNTTTPTKKQNTNTTHINQHATIKTNKE